MESINKKPLEVDFNNTEEDGAVRLHLPSTVKSLEGQNLQLDEGMQVWMTDGDVEVLGKVMRREDIWVALPCTEYKNVEISASYHVNNDSN